MTSTTELVHHMVEPEFILSLETFDRSSLLLLHADMFNCLAMTSIFLENDVENDVVQMTQWRTERRSKQDTTHAQCQTDYRCL